VNEPLRSVEITEREQHEWSPIRVTRQLDSITDREDRLITIGLKAAEHQCMSNSHPSRLIENHDYRVRLLLKTLCDLGDLRSS
jgi:hypothetical protein